MAKETTKSPIRCAFCGKNQDQVRRLIAGPGVYICNECVMLCYEILSDMHENVSAQDSDVNVNSVAAVQDLPNTGEAIAALTMLGYSQSEASVAVSKLDPALSVQDLIRGALKQLSRGV